MVCIYWSNNMYIYYVWWSMYPLKNWWSRDLITQKPPLNIWNILVFFEYTYEQSWSSGWVVWLMPLRSRVRFLPHKARVFRIFSRLTVAWEGQILSPELASRNWNSTIHPKLRKARRKLRESSRVPTPGINRWEGHRGDSTRTPCSVV